MPAQPPPAIKSLVFATDVDVLAADKLVSRGPGYWRIESPGNPTFWWGNFLLFDDPPALGDGRRWPEIFRREFAAAPQVRHVTFAWDRPDGAVGLAAQEFAAPYEFDQEAGLIAAGGAVKPHPRENREAQVRALNPELGADEALWDQVLEVQIAQRLEESGPGQTPELDMRDYRVARNLELRALFRSGRGAWYVALLEGQVAGSLGIVVTQGRARYQTVDTAARYRGRGVASRLVSEAARLAALEQPIDHYVIAADPDYHAISIYESLGFKRTELVCEVQLRPS